MNFHIKNGLPFINVKIMHNTSKILIDNVLIDTGSATSIISADYLENYDIVPEHNDQIHRMAGIGGYEYVVQKNVDIFMIDETAINNVSIQIGNMSYGFDINGIVGTDILLRMKSIINYRCQTISI